MPHPPLVLPLSTIAFIGILAPTQNTTAANRPRSVTCASFQTQRSAQAYFQKYQATQLDRDRDGIACESLPKRRRRRRAQRPVNPQKIQPISSPFTYRVVSVGDGDTIRVQQGFSRKSITVRLACIDAPEMRQGSYGKAASQRLKQLLPIGKIVDLRISNTDLYGRKVAEVINDGTNINLQMVQEGQAVVYDQYLSSCRRTIKQDLLKAEHLAKQQQLGFWQQSNPILPKVYRRRQRRR